MDVSPMSMTPADTPAGERTPLLHDDTEHEHGEHDPHSPPESFRRMSLAIAAARRFTLYEAAASAPRHSHLSPIASPTSPTSPTSPSSPSVPILRHESPTSPTSRFGISFGSYGGFGRGERAPPVRYASPLAEEDEESVIGSPGPGYGSTSTSARRRRQTTMAGAPGVPQRPPLRSMTGSSGRPRRMSSVVQARYRWLSGGAANTGDEPGVDVRSERDQEMYGHLRGKTHVTVVDYSSDPAEEDTNVRVDFDGERLAEWLKSKAGTRVVRDGKPSGVRWIHVSGLNWEVIKTLTLNYGLHPLAVEDALRSSRSPRSKVDFYANHLYLQIVLYHMHAPDRAALARIAEGIPEGVTIPCEEGAEGIGEGIKSGWRWPWAGRGEGQIRLPEGIEGVFELGGKDRVEEEDHRLVVEKLTASYMVPLRRGIVSIFMLRDGTLISLSVHEIHEALAPIYERLEDEHSLLRRSNDVSMLAHAILDVSVDLSVEITQAFESEIIKAEAKVLVQAQLDLVRHLHIIQAQILRFRRQLASLLHACYVIRDQDAQRAQAAGSLTAARREKRSSEGSASAPLAPPAPPATLAPIVEGTINPTGAHDPAPAPPPPLPPTLPPYENPHHNDYLPAHMTPLVSSAATAAAGMQPLAAAGRGSTASLLGAYAAAAPQGMGWFSPLAKVYMNDVVDHLEMVVSSSEQFAGTCDHLTDYCFNVLSFHTNNSMERLSIVTVVFLPLTFIASYFGMNFSNFPSLENPDSYFWRVAAPCTTAFFLVFSYQYLCSAWDTFSRRMTRYRRERQVKQKHE